MYINQTGNVVGVCTVTSMPVYLEESGEKRVELTRMAAKTIESSPEGTQTVFMSLLFYTVLAIPAKALKPGGKLVIITYHSLEDRMVKNFIKAGNIDGKVEKDFYGNATAPLKAVNRKPILPQEEEIASNTRARSAKLRIAEKI